MTRGGERLLCKAFNPVDSKCTKAVTDCNGIEFDVCTNTAASGYVCKLSAENGDCQNLLYVEIAGPLKAHAVETAVR